MPFITYVNSGRCRLPVGQSLLSQLLSNADLLLQALPTLRHPEQSRMLLCILNTAQTNTDDISSLMMVMFIHRRKKMGTSVIGQLWTRMVFLRTRTPKYPRLHISVNDIPAQKLNGISRKYNHRIVKSNKI